MSDSAMLRRLRPGRDPNDTSWVIARYLDNWREAATEGVGYNTGDCALELAPMPRPELAIDWLPLAPIAAPDGTLYVADPDRNLLLSNGPCDEDFTPVAGVGGHGFATGHFHRPLGVAVDGKGRVYVADAGNARVQVVLPEQGDVVAVLSDGLSRPVHVALEHSGKIFVADAATGSIHVFSATFAPLRTLPLKTLDPSTGERWSTPPAPRPMAVAVMHDGTLTAFDPARPALWHMTTKGVALPALPWPEEGERPPGWTAAPRCFTAAGEVILGPIDGGIHNLAWHRVLIEADFPSGTTLAVQTYADNDNAPSALSWAPRAPVLIPTAETDRPGHEADRLVLPERDAWPRWKTGRMIRARPEIFRFEGSGPVTTDRISLPVEAARHLRPGDRIALATDTGGRTEVAIVEAAPSTVSVAASGEVEASLAPPTVRLIAREDGELPFGPLDLAFLAEPATLALDKLRRDGRPEDAALPHGLAAFLRPGDVLSLGAGPDAERLEIVELPEDPVEFHLDRAVEGDFSTCVLILVDTAGRLLVRESLPTTAEVPPGAIVTVIDDVHTEQQPVVWIEAASGTIWLTAGALLDNITPASWTNAQFAAARATDRGRYLWVRLRLTGAPLPAPDGVGPPKIALATPSIRALRVTGPRPNLLDWMPALFSRRDPAKDPPGANFMERFLALFESQLTRIETAYESVSRLLNPLAADEEWLAFVASWLELAFDPSWPMERRRMLVIEGAALQAARGTPAALARYLEIYTGARPTITEAFRIRPLAPIQLGARGALGVAPLGGGEIPENFAHRFTVSVTLPADRDRAAARSAIRNIIQTMKPAHTQFALDTGEGRSGRIGIDSAIGNIVIPGPEHVVPCACDPEAESPRPQPGRVAGGFRLGGKLGHSDVSEIGF